MKKRMMILLSLMLVFSFALTACGKTEEPKEGSTINLPAIEAGGTDQSYPVNNVDDAYPITYEPAIAYPTDPSSPDYDFQMDAFLTEVFGEAAANLKAQASGLNAQQIRDLLTGADYANIPLTEGEMTAIVEWLAK